MTFENALCKALRWQKHCIRRRAWQDGVALVITKTHLDFQHIASCSITGPRPAEYLEDDWEVKDFGEF